MFYITLQYIPHLADFVIIYAIICSVICHTLMNGAHDTMKEKQSATKSSDVNGSLVWNCEIAFTISWASDVDTKHDCDRVYDTWLCLDDCDWMIWWLRPGTCQCAKPWLAWNNSSCTRRTALPDTLPGMWRTKSSARLGTSSLSSPWANLRKMALATTTVSDTHTSLH